MQRLVSLDAFRGFAIASMMVVNNPGDWGHLHAPLEHAKWDGWTFTDLVFPFFLFAAGMSMAISVDRRMRAGARPRAIAGDLARRAAVIFAVGLALNLFPAFDFSSVRIPGVLQRIALCVLAAAPFAVGATSRAVVLAIAALLAVYSVAMLLVPVPGPDGIVAAGVLEPGRDFGAWVDREVFGVHLWSQSRTWDPEGLWSTLPAIGSVLLGVLTGRWLLGVTATPRTSAILLGIGVAALAAGVSLDRVVMPINKSLWTPAYCVFMTGWSLVAFAFFHATMDSSAPAFRANARRFFLPLTIFGMNALFLFALSGFIGRLLATTHAKAGLYAPLKALPVAPENASLIFAIGFALAMFAVAWIMWRKGWFVKA